MTILTVGTGKQYTTIAAAVGASRDGDTVRVDAGTYLNDFVTVRTKISMESVGGMAIMQATVAPPNGKAILTVDNDLTITGFGFTGAAVADGNGAGIRYDTGNLTVRNSGFWKNQDGILANGDPTGNIVIEGSEFSQNGNGDGLTHNLYIGSINSLLVQNSYFHDTVAGHEVKSRAKTTTILNNRIIQNLGDGSYAIDIPDGGQALIQGNVIEKGVNAQNWITIHYGGENTPYAGSSLLVNDNTIVNDNVNGYLIANNAPGVTATLSNNRVYGYDTSRLTIGTVNQVNETTLTTRPTLNLASALPSSPIVVTPPVVAPTTNHVPDGAVYTTFGREGAVVASGHILTVGAQAQFKTLAQALAASVDGDTIQVAAGTYVNDFGTVNRKVIIEGVGGIAHLTQRDRPGAPNGLLVVNNDVTIRNMEFSNNSNYGGRTGGIAINNGNVTIVNSTFHDNDMGIVAGDNRNTTVSIYGSDIGRNGNSSRGTHNLFFGDIGSLTIKDSVIHEATTGHELFDHAYFSNIENNRFYDGLAESSFIMDLGLGGRATIANNTLVKGRDSANGIFLQLGGDGAVYDNTNIAITGNTLIQDMVNPGHPYTYFINAADALVAAGPVSIANNTFVGGVPGSRQAINATPTGSVVLAQRPVVNTTSPVSAALAGSMAKTPNMPNTIIVQLGETKAWQDAEFVVKVDGVAVGGGIVTADHATQASQSFRFTGWWGAGQHTVSVTGTNLASTADTFAYRLFVDSISLDGASVAPSRELDRSSTTYTTVLAGKDILPDFDAAYYAAYNPDVIAAGVNPLQHYLNYGWREGRNPSAWFNTKYYLDHNPTVAAAGTNPLVDFEKVGWTLGRDPSALFSTSAYLAANADVAAAYIDPLLHYTTMGRAEGRAAYAINGQQVTSSDPLVDTAYYLAHNPGSAFNVDAAADYHNVGWKLGADPSAWFSTAYYLNTNPDIKAAGVDPLAHFETYGWREGRNPSPWFSNASYNAANPQSAGQDPLLAFIQSGLAPADVMQSPYKTAEARLFDPTYYLAHNPDVAAAHVDPVVHYNAAGWKENRDPSAAFSTNKYLTAYADVRAAGVDPLAHYAINGINEGRLSFAV